MNHKRVFLFCLISLLGFSNFLSGGSEKIVFAVKTDEYNSVIYTINPDGSGLQELFSWQGEPADGDGRICELRISPGGEYIAFASNHDRYYSPHEWNIFHIASDGSWWDQDTPDAAAGWYDQPGGRGTVNGYVYRNGGTPVSYGYVTIEGCTVLTTTNASGYYEISDVPEGSRFVTAFTSAYSWYGYVPVNVVDGMAVQAPDISTTEDTDYRLRSDAPVCSPDANYLYWQGLDESVWKSPTGGDSWTHIFPGPPAFVDRSTIDISPVSGKIVYTWSVWDPRSGGVYTANLDGSDTTKIFDDQWAYASSVYYPRWSPDGEKIAYVSFQDDNNAAVIIDKNGTYQSHFWFEGCYLFVGGWSADSKWLAVAIEPISGKTEDSSYIYIVRPDFIPDSCAYIYGPANIEIGVDWGILNPQGIEETIVVAADFSLRCYPNPFILGTFIKYEIPDNKECEIKIFDVSGRVVETFKGLGKNGILRWEGNTPAGVYFIHLSAGNTYKTLKVTKLR